MLDLFKDHIKKICDIMGEDFNDPACQEVLDHLNQCPTCRVYYDTVKKTVLLCQNNDCAEELPEGVNDRLMEVLNLTDFLKKHPEK